MNIQQFQYILAVAEYKHFELAAEKCNISQSTLSTMISKFEEEIAIQIFDRKKKPVQITNEGTLIISQLKLVTNQIDHLKEIVREIKGEIKGNLSLSVIPTIAPFLLPLFLPDFAASFPNLNIQVREETTAEIQRKLKLRELDIGIVSIPLQDKELTEVKLYDEPFLFYDTTNTQCQNLSAMNVNKENLYLMEEGHCMRAQVLQFCSEKDRINNTKLNFEFKAGSIDSLLRFVKANGGSTLIPYLATYHFLEQDKQHISHFKQPVPFRTVGILVHRHFVKKKLLKSLQQIIVQKIADKLPESLMDGKILYPVL